MKYTIYREDNGEITHTLDLDDYDTLLANIDEGFDFIPGRYLSDEFYIENDVAVQMPPRPGDWAVFDYNAKVWLDPRTDSERTNELNQIRANTRLDKSDLLIRLALAGILSEEEADEAAGGVIPASMQPMLAQLPPEAQMVARIKWKSDTVISRTHPVIVSAAYAMGITDEQLDEIFDVA